MSNNPTEWELDLALSILISGFEPVDAKPNERRRVYIARDYDNENYPPEQARQYIDVPKYCSNWNETMPLLIESRIPFKFTPKGSDDYSVEDMYECGKDQFKATDKNPLKAIVLRLIKHFESQGVTLR